MIKKIFLTIALVVSQQAIVSQVDKTCDSPTDDPLLDFNSITKCTIEGTEKTDDKNKTVKIQVTSRRRVVRKRSAVTTGASQDAAAKKIASLKQKASLVGSLDLSNEDLIENVPFNIVEEIPVFKSCTDASISEQDACFKEQIAKHIRKHFNYPQSAYDKSIQGRVYTQFVIDKNGEISDLNIRGPYEGELLEAEAKRIISKLPKFTPGKHHGRTVKVKYGVPITFRIPGRKPSNIKKKTVDVKKIISNAQVFNFDVVDQLPLFSDCTGSTGDAATTCFNKGIIKHVNKHFAYPSDAIDNNVEGKVVATFIIDTNGNVADIKAKGPVGTEVLENATKSLFKKLPKFTPAQHNGKPVNVKYTFPVDFLLD